jgi:hypothetical protein
MRNASRLRILLALLGVVALAACSSEPPSPIASITPTSEATPAPTSASGGSLRLALFVDGKIVSVRHGQSSTIVDWPSATAPYEPPVAARGGFVGLTDADPGVGLSFVSKSASTELAPPPLSQGFGVSPDGAFVAYGRADLSKITGSTQLVLRGGKAFRHIAAETTMRNAKGTAGDFIDGNVMVQSGDGGAVSTSAWDPAAGDMALLRGFTEAGPADAATNRIVLTVGDGGCWQLGTWPDLGRSGDGPGTCGVGSLAFSPDGSRLAGVAGQVDLGMSGSRRNQLLVIDPTSGHAIFQSPAIPGAMQSAWEDGSHVLVLARDGKDQATVTRCDIDQQRCETVWTFADEGQRYGVWLVVTPPSN